jgi:hypothetical protein
VAALVVWNTRIAREQQLKTWLVELSSQLGNSQSAFWRQPDDGHAHAGWLLFQGEPADMYLLDRVPLPARFTVAAKRRLEPRQRLPGGDRFLVKLAGPWPMKFAAEYSVLSQGDRIIVGDFFALSLLVQSATKWIVLLLLLLPPVLDRAVITAYRRRQLRAYEAYERERTREVYEAREKVASARALTDSGDLAKALVAVNEALTIIPEYPEARELRGLIMGLMDDASLLPGRFAPPVADVDETLYLRVVGTPYAYRALAGATTIRVGRQRPKDEADPDANDLVIRVPASTDRSLRISRHHFEVNRIGREYFVVDHSGGHTRLNGVQLQKGQPAKVSNGDRLLIADVMALELSVRPSISRSPAQVLRVGAEAGHFNLEATVGDMLTEG